MKTKQSGAKKQQDLKRVAECLYRSQNSNIYYAILKRGGKQIKRSLKTTDSALAKRRLKDLNEQAASLTKGGEAKLTFEIVAERWLKMASTSMKQSSANSQAGVIKSLSKFFGTVQVRKLTKVMLEDWAAERSKEIAARTYNLERESMIRVLDYAQREGVILENPARILKRLKVRQTKPVIPTKREFEILISEIRKMRRDAHASADLCELLAYSGCRLREATAITWGDINLKKKQFTVTGGERGTKNHESRTIPLFPALEHFLKRLLDTMEEPPRKESTVSKIENAKKALKSACKNGDLPNFTHHHLRHFFCSNAIEAGIDFKAIAGWLGHKDGGLLVAKTYGHLRDEHSAEMAKRMTYGVMSDNGD
jgi:integrase